MEARVSVLETHVEYIREGIIHLETAAAAARTDSAAIRVDMATLTANVGHLPSKGFIVGALLLTLAAIAGITVFMGYFGLLIPGK